MTTGVDFQRLADDSDLPLRAANFVSGPEALAVVLTPTRPELR